MKTDQQKRIFDEWLSTHRGVFFKVVRAYAADPADRDDLFQEIALQVWRSVPKYRGDCSVPTWIYRVSLYTAIAWSRRESNRVQGTEPLGDGHGALSEGSALQDDRLKWLYDQIARLNPIDRSVGLLLLDGYRYREIAEILGITENHVGVKINRIKKHLTTQRMEDENHGIQ